MEKVERELQLRLAILEELRYCVGYAGQRADGSINGADLMEAIERRMRELENMTI
jgi:hypothetical protein